ncbi:MAG: RNA methyltransferase [Saprospiraceae bacterium]
MRKLRLDELNRVSVEQYKLLPKRDIIIVLDNIRSAMNVGSIFRTADAFAIKKIVICGISAVPPHREITKTAIGASESVDWQYEKEIYLAIKSLKDEGYTIIGIEQTDQSFQLQSVETSQPKLAVIFGNEVDGISTEVLDLLDMSIEIPQYGTKHSLNVSVCAGIVMWEMVRGTL